MIQCLMSFDRLFYGLLVKRFNTLPSQGNIHGSESRTGYQIDTKLELLKLFDKFEFYNVLIYDKMI